MVDTFTEAKQISVDAHVRKLEQRGPNLPFPYSSGISGSRHAHMRELRVQSGDKTGDRRFYDRMIPLADRLYDEHLAELEKEKNHGR